MRAWITCSFTDPGYVSVNNDISEKSQKKETLQETVEKDALNTVAISDGEAVNPEAVNHEPDTHETLAHENVSHESQSKKVGPGAPAASRGPETGQKTKFCEFCQLKQEQGVYHCDQCGHCVRKYDHHCPFLGNCIGQRNYRYFYKFCLYATLSSFYSLILSLFGFIRTILEDAIDVEKSGNGSGNNSVNVNSVVLKEEYGGVKFLFLVVGGSGIFVFSFIGACFPFGMCVSNVCGIFEEFTEVEKEVVVLDPETN